MRWKHILFSLKCFCSAGIPCLVSKNTKRSHPFLCNIRKQLQQLRVSQGRAQLSLTFYTDCILNVPYFLISLTVKLIKSTTAYEIASVHSAMDRIHILHITNSAIRPVSWNLNMEDWYVRSLSPFLPVDPEFLGSRWPMTGVCKLTHAIKMLLKTYIHLSKVIYTSYKVYVNWHTPVISQWGARNSRSTGKKGDKCTFLTSFKKKKDSHFPLFSAWLCLGLTRAPNFMFDPPLFQGCWQACVTLD